MVSHYIIECPVCQVIWQQCRCAPMDLAKTEEICPSCRQIVHAMEVDYRRDSSKVQS